MRGAAATAGPQPIIAVLGPHGSGKTALSLALGELLDAELISADSRQVYQGFPLCTNQASEAERQQLRHHLVEIEVAGSQYDLARFLSDAVEVHDDISRRGHVTLLSGGTCLYATAFLDAYRLVSVAPEPQTRRELDSRPLEELQQIILELQPSAGEHVELHNRRRLIRAIEIARAGVDLSEMRSRGPAPRSLRLGLRWEEDDLRERVDRRMRERLQQGLVSEVAEARKVVDDSWLYDLGLEFRWSLRLLRGEVSTQTFEEGLLRSLWGFVSKQIKWLRKDASIIWVEPCPKGQVTARELVLRHLEGNAGPVPDS